MKISKPAIINNPGFASTSFTSRFLNFRMKSRSFDEHRAIVAKGAQGIVLEIGFGSGLNLSFYDNEKISKIYTLDVTDELFKLTKINSQKQNADPSPDSTTSTAPTADITTNITEKIEFILASAEQIPLPDNSIDTIVSTWTLCSIPDPHKALQEIWRVLKPGGSFRFVEHGKSPSRFWAKIQDWGTPITRKCSSGCHLNRDIEAIIKSSGLEIEKLEKISLKTKPLGCTYRGIVRKRSE